MYSPPSTYTILGGTGRSLARVVAVGKGADAAAEGFRETANKDGAADCAISAAGNTAHKQGKIAGRTRIVFEVSLYYAIS